MKKDKLLLIITFLIGCLFTFPLFKENISSIFLITTTVVTVFYLSTAKEKILFKKQHLIYTLPFFIVLCTNIFAINAEIDWKNVSKSLMFLIFPLVFFNIPANVFKNLETKFIYIFKFSCLIISSFYIISFLLNHSFSDFFNESYNESVFRKHVYSIAIFKIHPTYFSLFLNVGIIHSLLRFKKELKYLNLFTFIFSLIMILLLSSRLMIVISFISIIYAVTKGISIKKRYFIPIIAVFFSGLIFLPGIKSRFLEAYNDFNNPPKGMYFNSTNIRKSIISCSFEILQENYLRGVGFSNIQTELNECYAANYDSKFYENHDYLTHNYLMYIFLGSGILGFSIFLFYLFTVIRNCLKIKNVLLNVVLFNCIALFFVEDFLYRHYGLFFFNLFVFSYLKFYEYTLKENV